MAIFIAFEPTFAQISMKFIQLATMKVLTGSKGHVLRYTPREGLSQVWYQKESDLWNNCYKLINLDTFQCLSVYKNIVYIDFCKDGWNGKYEHWRYENSTLKNCFTKGCLDGYNSAIFSNDFIFTSDCNGRIFQNWALIELA